MSNFIRAWRVHRGLTQQALAERIGIARSYLSMIESGARPASSHILGSAAAVLGCTLEELIARDPTEPDDLVVLLSGLSTHERMRGLAALKAMFGKD